MEIQKGLFICFCVDYAFDNAVYLGVITLFQRLLYGCDITSALFINDLYDWLY